MAKPHSPSAIESALAAAKPGVFTPADARKVLADAGGPGAFCEAFKAATGRECQVRGWPCYQGEDGRVYSTDPQRPGPVKASDCAF